MVIKVLRLVAALSVATPLMLVSQQPSTIESCAQAESRLVARDSTPVYADAVRKVATRCPDRAVRIYLREWQSPPTDLEQLRALGNATGLTRDLELLAVTRRTVLNQTSPMPLRLAALNAMVRACRPGLELRYSFRDSSYTSLRWLGRRYDMYAQPTATSNPSTVPGAERELELVLQQLRSENNSVMNSAVLAVEGILKSELRTVSKRPKQ